LKKERVPSHHTIARALENIDFDQFIKIFYEWAKTYVDIEEKEWISIDGKAIAGTVRNPHNKLQEYINLVSVFASKRRQVLSAGKVENKSNEIPLVQQLMKELDLEGVIFTLDALHCQRKTTKAVVESKNDYVIGVKGNQKKLLKTIKKTARNVIQ
jgi:hypothetical protein